jgi:hypothetical protein
MRAYVKGFVIRGKFLIGPPVEVASVPGVKPIPSSFRKNYHHRLVRQRPDLARLVVPAGPYLKILGRAVRPGGAETLMASGADQVTF